MLVYSFVIYFLFCNLFCSLSATSWKKTNTFFVCYASVCSTREILLAKYIILSYILLSWVLYMSLKSNGKVAWTVKDKLPRGKLRKIFLKETKGRPFCIVWKLCLLDNDRDLGIDKFQVSLFFLPRCTWSNLVLTII